MSKVELMHWSTNHILQRSFQLADNKNTYLPSPLTATSSSSFSSRLASVANRGLDRPRSSRPMALARRSYTGVGNVGGHQRAQVANTIGWAHIVLNPTTTARF